ncbi:MAG: hypothetical protein OXN19_06970 [Caldilineaceae bacterium]|nr:hypothetical protein [Caldilineaceae bacterium]
MAKKKHTPEQVINKPREAEVAIAQGRTTSLRYRPPAPEALLPADPVPVL